MGSNGSSQEHKVNQQWGETTAKVELLKLQIMIFDVEVLMYHIFKPLDAEVMHFIILPRLWQNNDY